MGLSEDQKAMLRLLAQREQGYDDIASLTGSSVDDVRAKVKSALSSLDDGLSEDQKAMLRLLAQREEGYADIGALTGSGVDEVREKVKVAIAALDEGAETRSPGPPSPPAEPPPPPPKPKTEKPEPAPKAEKPKPEPAPKPAAKPSRPAPKLSLPEDRGALRALIAGAAVVLIIVLLLVTGVLGGGDDGSSDSTAATAGGESTLNGEAGGGTPTANGKRATQAILEPVDGSDATGQALFGRTGRKVVLLLGAKGLQPAPKGQSYTVSLVRSESQRLPLIATTATKSGIVSGRFEIAPQVLGLLAGGFDTMELSLVPNDELRVALAQARKSKKAPNYGGTTILEGPVTGPIVEAGEKENEG